MTNAAIVILAGTEGHANAGRLVNGLEAAKEFAENCHGHGVYVEEEGELDVAFEDAIAYDGPALVEIPTDSEPV